VIYYHLTSIRNELSKIIFLYAVLSFLLFYGILYLYYILGRVVGFLINMISIHIILHYKDKLIMFIVFCASYLTNIESLKKVTIIPLYELKCPKCNKSFEYIVPLAKYNEKIKCPKCKKGVLKKVMTPVLFKI